MTLREDSSTFMDGYSPDVEMFSDAAKYSYTALCSLALRDLYCEDQPHHTFSTDLVKNIRIHLGLPRQSDEVMFALFMGEGVQSGQVYVELGISIFYLQYLKNESIIDFYSQTRRTCFFILHCQRSHLSQRQIRYGVVIKLILYMFG